MVLYRLPMPVTGCPDILNCPYFQVNWSLGTLCCKGWQQSVPPNGLLITHNYFAIVEGTSPCFTLSINIDFLTGPMQGGRGQGRGAVPLQPCAKKSQFNLISADSFFFPYCYSIEFDCPADALALNTNEKKSKMEENPQDA